MTVGWPGGAASEVEVDAPSEAGVGGGFGLGEGEVSPATTIHAK